MKNIRAFTIIELMIVIAIMGIMFVFANTMLSGYLVQKDVVRVTDALSQDLRFARNAAQTYSSDVTVKSRASDWKYGWEIIKNSDDSTLRVNEISDTTATVTGPSEDIVFTPQGSTQKDLTFKVKRNGCSSENTSITVKAVGQIITKRDQGC